MAHEAVKAAETLAREGIECEVIDLRTAKPIDQEILQASVKKTGRLLIADGSWKTCGWAAEVSALVSEDAFSFLKAPIRRVTLPDCPAPASAVLEQVYYRTQVDIAQGVRDLLHY
jgi:pyruvate dehydrogenase E1 component beta subunit